jgi:hypothetical protein
MRRSLFSLTITGMILMVFASPAVLKSKAKEAAIVAQAQPGSRCTRLTFGPRPKKKDRKSQKQIAAATGTARPGTRCLRLLSGARPGSILPNTAPKVGIAAPSSYVGTNGDTQAYFHLKVIACDPDGDSVLYTYSVTGGQISGDGESALWNLSGVTRPSTYTVTVEVDDGCGCISFDSAQVTLE